MYMYASISMYVRMYVCVYVCMYVCMYVKKNKILVKTITESYRILRSLSNLFYPARILIDLSKNQSTGGPRTEC